MKENINKHTNISDRVIIVTLKHNNFTIYWYIHEQTNKNGSFQENGTAS